MTDISMNALASEIHQANIDAGWWTNIRTGQLMIGNDEFGDPRRNVPEMLILVISELCEAAEGLDGGLMDDKLPHRRMVEVELGDTMIRILDLGGHDRIDFDAIEGLLLDEDELITFAFEETDNDCILLLIREVIKAMEGRRRNISSDIIGGCGQFEVSLTRVLFGCIKLGELMNLDVVGALKEKREYNKTREDHKLANRLAPGGKRC